jgi:hypothetical protein
MTRNQPQRIAKGAYNDEQEMKKEPRQVNGAFGGLSLQI